MRKMTKKGSKIIIQLQDQVDFEFEKQLMDSHIEKSDAFIQPTLVTVTKQKSVKIALDPRR